MKGRAIGALDVQVPHVFFLSPLYRLSAMDDKKGPVSQRKDRMSYYLCFVL
jgi:hypothetical protein